jgi:MFS family permease
VTRLPVCHFLGPIARANAAIGGSVRAWKASAKWLLWCLAVAACVLVGAASVTFLTTGNATIQLASKPSYRGRVTALWLMAFVGSTPIGAPIVGALSDAAGPRYALALGAAACLAAVVVGRWTGKPTPQPSGS